MNPNQKQAIAESQDLANLRQFLVNNKANEGRHEEIGRILHLEVWKKNNAFFKEAIQNILQPQLVEKLLCHRESIGENKAYNLLHVAVSVRSLEVVKAIINHYHSEYYSGHSYKDLPLESKPWLAKDSNGSTPLHIALQLHDEKCAKEILDLDFASLFTSVDDSGNSPLFLAVREGLNEVAETILESTHRYIDTGENGFFTALHYAPNRSSVKVCKLLIEKETKKGQRVTHKSKMPMLHKWIELRKASNLFRELNAEQNKDFISNETIKSYLVNLITKCDHKNENAFHLFAKDQKIDASKTIAEFYNKHKGKDQNSHLPPWLIQNNSTDTPLHLALKHDKNVYEWLKDTYCDAPFKLNEVGPLVRAVKKRKYDVATQIGETLTAYGWRPFCPNGKKFWQVLGNGRTDVEVAKWLVEHLPNLIPEDEAVEALNYASKEGYEWLVESVLKEHPSALENYPLAWVEACEKGHYKTVVAFIQNCPYFGKLCVDKRTTPLHHVKLNSYEEYRQLLENPVMKRLRNFQDELGATPLHHAIKTRNMELTELLLKMEDVYLSIKNKDNNTPIQLLHDEYKKCKVQNLPGQGAETMSDQKQWKEMCMRNGIIPSLKLIYFRDKAKAYDLRNTVSVVAALLATITFTVGFTVPGGFDQDKGDALLGDKAAFLVFILSDVFAMLCSLVTLVFFMLSVISYPPKSLVLIEKSLKILKVALVSSAMAFMSGVYVVLRKKCLWVSILIIFFCSVFILLAISNKWANQALTLFSPDLAEIDLEQGQRTTSQENVTAPTGQTTIAEENNSLLNFKRVFKFLGARLPPQRKSE